MGSISTKAIINNSVINGIKGTFSDALYKTGDAIVSDIKTMQVMPFDTGRLQESLTVVKLKDKSIMISTNEVYARRLYYHPEYNFLKTKNQNAGAYWFEEYKTGITYDMFCEILRGGGSI